MGFLQGKKILITGIVSNRSIAYGIAKCCHREGAELAFSYANERFKDRVAGFAADFGSDFVLQMDVSSDEQIDNAFAQIKERWGALDELKNVGAPWTVWFTQSALLRVKPLPVTSLKAARVMLLKQPWIFPLTLSRQSPEPLYP